MSLRITLIASLTPVAFAALHCHHDDDDGPPASLADVVFAQGTSDEALEALLATGPKAGEKRAHFSAPKSGDKLTDSPTFTWAYEGKTGMPGPEPLLRRANGRAGSWGLPLAHAHGDPMNGTGYLLVVSTSSDPKLLRVFTKASTFTPDAAAWDKIKKAASGPVQAVVTTGLFENNKLVQNGGPFEGEAITFEVVK